LSRFKFGNPAPDKNGVQILLNNGAKIAFFNVHLNYIPYQPYQLLQIPYGNAPFIRTETEALAEAIKARGHDVKAALNDISAMKDENIPLILAGDFNEPSHQDWTEAAAKAGRHPIKVSWPSTKAFADAGLTDAYRKLYPDEMERPGYTWTNTTAPDDPKDHHDRIDFIFYRGKGLLPRSAYIIGESTANADIVIVPYPGDHRSVAVEFTLAGKTAR
jgi:endonuclease/exonuclease/phosphatase family metal-dependent hydrolase